MDALGPSILRLDPSTLQALLQRLQGQQDAAPGQAELAQALRGPDAQASQEGGHVDVQALPLEDIAYDNLTPEKKAQAHGDPDEEERLYQAMVAQVRQEHDETQVGDEQERAFAAQQAQLAQQAQPAAQEPDGDESQEPPLQTPQMLPEGEGDEKQSRLQAMLAALLRQ